jgi:hypothetical protein
MLFVGREVDALGGKLRRWIGVVDHEYLLLAGKLLQMLVDRCVALVCRQDPKRLPPTSTALAASGAARWRFGGCAGGAKTLIELELNPTLFAAIQLDFRFTDFTTQW